MYPEFNKTLNHIAEIYVYLVLSVGQHDNSYVDAYYGPNQLSEKAKQDKKPLVDIKFMGEEVIRKLKSIDIEEINGLILLRYQYLLKQLQSLVARVEMLLGKVFTFDEEAKALYDVSPPIYTEDDFQKIISEIDDLLTGKGTVSERYEHFKKKFIIPIDKLDSTFKAAINECRNRTKKYIQLPDNENFVIEYVNDKPWSGYNWYKGNNFSLIQVNTDLPIYIDRAIDLAAHEGYPGHHVYNSLLETILYREYGWIESSVYALFSPQSLIAEGTANFGIEVAFPGEDRVNFEKNVLFPLASIDATEADLYYKIHNLFLKLAYAGNEAARGYLDGKLNREQAIEWLVKYALMSPDRAKQRTHFFDKYRSYVINYNLGQDLVKQYIEKRGGNYSNPQKMWEEFSKLISSPILPSVLV